MSEKKLSFTNPYLLLSLTTLMWGGNAVAGKIANGHISPFLLTTCRWTLVCIVLIPLAMKYLKRDWHVIRENLVFLIVCGAIGFAAFNNFMYLALTYTTAINASIEQAAMPLIVFGLNYLLFKTRTTSYQLIGFVITIAGILVMVSRGDFAALLAGNFNVGDLIMLFAIMLYGTYSVILRNKPDIHLMSFLTVLSIAAFFTSIPFTLYEASTDKFLMPDMIGLGVIAYACIFPSVLAQFFWVMGLEQIGSNRGGLFINLVPIFGAVLAVLILGEQIRIYHAIGFILVLGGIALAQKVSVKVASA